MYIETHMNSNMQIKTIDKNIFNSETQIFPKLSRWLLVHNSSNIYAKLWVNILKTFWLLNIISI